MRMIVIADTKTKGLSVFMISLALGLACATPLFYYGGPPDLLLGSNPRGSWLFITPTIMTAVAALVLGRRSAERILLSIVGGTAAMACASLLLHRWTWTAALVLLPIGLALGGAAVGHTAGTLIVFVARAISHRSSFTGEQSIAWGSTVLGMLGSFGFAGAGFATSLDRMTLDYWIGGFYALSFVVVSTSLASAISIAVLGVDTHSVRAHQSEEDPQAPRSGGL